MKHLGTKTLESDRLILRKLTLEDAESAYNNWCNSDKVDKYVLWTKHKDVNVTKSLYEIWVNEYSKDNIYRWIVELKDTHEVIGTIDAFNKYMPYDTCEIGYVYGEKYWGCGYATEALQTVLKFLFEECELELAFAGHLDRNPASGRVMVKSGMIYEATLRSRIVDKDGIRNDELVYSITKDEYFKNKES